MTISALAPLARADAVAHAMLRETTSLGVRRYTVARLERPRTFEHVDTPYGRIPIKVAEGSFGPPQMKPEFDACAAAAAMHGVPVREVLRAAMAAASAHAAPPSNPTAPGTASSHFSTRVRYDPRREPRPSVGGLARRRHEGNTMSACSRCGTVAKATDKFCNVCGTPLARTGASNAPPPPPGPQYAPTPAQGPAADPGFAQTQAPPPQPGGFGVGVNRRCQMGHEIAAGASYCVARAPDRARPDAVLERAVVRRRTPPGLRPSRRARLRSAPGARRLRRAAAAGRLWRPASRMRRPAAPAYTPAASPYGAPPGQPYGQTPAPQGGYAPPPQQGYARPRAGTAPLPRRPRRWHTTRRATRVPPKILRGFLVAYDANPSGDFWPLTGGRLIVGRLGAVEGIDISMQAPTISSRHAAMVVDATSGAISVEDTGSTNGTFVNDEHIGFNGRRELRDGDRLRFGGYTTIVKVIGRF